MSDEIFIRALNLSYFFLKFRPRTKREMTDYLVKKSKRYHFGQDVINQVIDQLIDENLINDQDFVNWFVEQRASSRPKGRFVLTTELIRLGIERDLIDEYFQNTPFEENDLALKALSRRWHQWAHLAKEKRFQKAVAFLSRRGFNFETIKKSVVNLENKR